jgi:hypothetical protein
MKLATVITNLSSELAYTVLMVMTWIMLLGWSAAVISACVLAFRNRKEDDETRARPRLIQSYPHRKFIDLPLLRVSVSKS